MTGAFALLRAGLGGVMLACAHAQVDSDWGWPLLALAWTPWLMAPSAGAGRVLLEGWLLLFVGGAPLLQGAAAAVGIALAVGVLLILSAIGVLPFALLPWLRRRLPYPAAVGIVLSLFAGVERMKEASILNWIGIGDPLGESAIVAPLLSVVGSWGAVLLVLLANCAWIAAWHWRRAPERGLVALGVAVGVLLLPWGIGAIAGHGEAASTRELRAALVAPVLDPGIIDDDAWRVERLLDAYRRLDPTRIDLAVMPQMGLAGASPSDPSKRRELLELVARRGIPLLAGSVERIEEKAGGAMHNSVFLLTPERARRALAGKLPETQAVLWQAKRKLVPLTEYLPGWLAWWLGDNGVPRTENFVAGRASRPLALDGDAPLVGAMLCYDAYDAAIAVDLRRQGAQVLVVVASDESFSGSALSRQGLRAARLRAMENALPTIRIAWSAVGGGAYDRVGRGVPQQPSSRDLPAGVRVFHLPL